MSSPEAGKPVVAVEGLARWFQAGDTRVHALCEVDFSVAPGEFVSVMGPSGSGKSTLLYLLGCLDRASAGTLRICGSEPARLDDAGLSELRKRRIGFVFQSFNLLARWSILENVLLPLRYAGVARTEARDRAVALLTRVGLADRLHHRPTELSGGQCQRAAIARALANDPPLILADEPTGNLDQATGREVLSLFHELAAEGRTLVLVTHDEHLAASTSRILRMRDGRLESDQRLAGTGGEAGSGAGPTPEPGDGPRARAAVDP